MARWSVPGFLWAACTAAMLACAAAEGVTADEEAEAISKATNMGVSIMLLGSVGFMMGLFYLVNHHDADMVKYSWQVISDTISIFSAVLLFQAVNGIIEKTILEGASEGFELWVSVAHFLIWFTFLQVALAYFSGAVKFGKAKHEEEDEDEVEKRLKCYAVLLGHITGFAAINAFGVFQQQIPRSVANTFLVAPLAWIVVYLLSQVMDHVREAINRADNEITKCEELWDAETEETEDDIIGLAVSFLLAQTLRLAVGGTLPNAEGEEPEEGLTQHTNFQVMMLLGCGFLFVAAEFFRTIYIKFTFARLTPQGRNIVMMCCAWCLYFGTDWWISHNVFVNEHGMTKQVVLALVVTAMSLSLISVLDTIADMPVTGKTIAHAVRSVVRALAILIGFSWEKSFDTAVNCITDSLQDVLPEPITKLGLACLLVLLVVPAWRHFILPTVINYEKQEEEEAEAEAAREAGGDVGKLENGVEGLAEPLLGEGHSPKSARKESSDANSRALKQKCKEYEHHIKSLESRNTKLESSLEEFIGELKELQSMADVLKKSPNPK